MPHNPVYPRESAMHLPSHFSRRDAMKTLAAATPAILSAGALVAASSARAEDAAAAAPAKRGVRIGKLRQSVCNWSWGHGLENLCKFCVEYGLTGIDLLDPGDFPMVKKYNLQCSLVGGIGNGFGIGKGLNRKENHEGYLKFLMARVDAASEAGFKQVICFSGNRGGLSDAEGLDNCVPALVTLARYAKNKNVTITMELLNSKDHRDYMCDTSKWGVELCEKVAKGMDLDPAKAGAKDSHFGLLYDIYHMQRMEGDIINTIRQNKRWYNHYHTAGNPGRGPLLGKGSEMNYTPIAKAVLEAINSTGQTDTFMAHEFCGGSANDHLEAVELCDVG